MLTIDGSDADRLSDLVDDLDALIGFAQVLNANDAPTRSRELSLCITHLQEASHWLRDIPLPAEDRP